MKIMLFKLSNSLRMGISMIKCTLDQVIVLCIWIACIFFIAGLGVQDQFTKHRQKQAQEIKKMKYEIGEKISFEEAIKRLEKAIEIISKIKEKE